MPLIGKAGRNVFRSHNIATPEVPIDWYLTDGVLAANVVRAYRPKGTTTWQDSVINLVNPGTGDAGLYEDIVATKEQLSNDGWGFVYGGIGYADVGGNIVMNQNTTVIIKYAVGLVDWNTEYCGYKLYCSSDGVGGVWQISLDDNLSIRCGIGTPATDITTYPVSNTSGVLTLAPSGLYANGSLVAEITTPETFEATVPFIIGAYWDGASNFMVGSIHAIAIYNIALSAEQIAAISENMKYI